jgi:ADP-heptose:LPS heptosyltransferase
MNFILHRVSLSDLINRSKIVSFGVNSILILFFSCIRKIIRTFAYNNGNVVVIALHRLGDTIFTMPAIRAIQMHYQRRIIVVCFPESVPIYNLAFSDICFCTVEQSDLLFWKRIPNFKLKKQFRSLKPGIIIDLIGGMSTAFLIFNSRAKKIIGINKKQFKSIYDHFVEIRERPQLKDIYLDAIAPVIHITDRAMLKELPIAYNPQGRILIHPFAGWKEKEWNLNNYLRIAEVLNEDYNVCLVAQQGQISIDVLLEMKNSGIKLIETKSVDELIQNIKDCSLFIGNDSGPVNIANYLGKPTFTIYGATNPAYAETNEDHQIYIQKTLKCSARQNEKFCIIGGAEFKCTGTQCMNLLTIEEVCKKLIPLAGNYCNRKANPAK